MARRKNLDICEGGLHLKAYQTDDAKTPYKLYLVWYDRGSHSKQIGKYADFQSVTRHVASIYANR